MPVRIRRTHARERISMRADVVKREIRITMPTYAPTASSDGLCDAKTQLDRRPLKQRACGFAAPFRWHGGGGGRAACIAWNDVGDAHG